MVEQVDALTLTVLQHRLQQIAEEMDSSFDRASFSPVISEGQDRACGIYSREGLLVAQGHGQPIHIGVMQFAAQTVSRLQEHQRPGDVYIVNDPYSGGTHLLDVKLIMPIFVENRVFCYLGSTGHWPDIGGSVAGGFVSHAREVHQEGLRLPPVRLYKGGQLNDELLAVILANVRVPDQRIGDLKAQIAAMRVGERALRKVIEEYGADVLSVAIVELRRRAAGLMRGLIREIPAGRYEFEEQLDNDGVVDEPLLIKLAMTVMGGDMRFDFSGSSPPCRGPLNSPYSTTCSAVYLAMKHVLVEVPMNAGCFEPIEVVAPTDTFLNASYPRPTAGCASEVSQRIVDVVFGALAKAMGERMHAAPVGTALNLSIGGYDPGQEKYYVFYFYSGGGHGGYPGGDGISNACTAIGSAKTPPIEILEQQYPLLFREYSLRPDSPGPGRHRGGLGARYSIELLRGEASLSILGDRGKRGPFGVFGGGPGATTKIAITNGGSSFTPSMLTKINNHSINVGDSVAVETPGGGGFERASERSRGAIDRDLRRQYITDEYVRRNYSHYIKALGSMDHGTSD